jgi:hypothetical protein
MTTTTESPTAEDAAAARRKWDREHMRRWRAANPEKAREATRRSVGKWRAANPEKAREAMRKWRAANPEKVREYYNAKREVVCERNRKWREANADYNRERIRKYYQTEHGRRVRAEYREHITGPRVDDLRARCEYVMNEVFHTDAQRRRFALALLNRGWRHPLVRSLLFHWAFDMEHIAPYVEEVA